MPRKPSPSSSVAATSRPRFIEPMAATAVKVLPGAGWLHEIKLDGYRVLMIRDGSSVELRTRKDRDLAHTFPQVAAAALHLRSEQVVLDGELVALDADGRPSFQALQHRGRVPDHHQLMYYAFDVLHVDGHDVMAWPLEDRRAKLPELISEMTVLRISRDLPGTPAEILAAVQRMGLEGVVAKQLGSLYTPGERSTRWVKLKLHRQQAFVVGGYRPDGEQSIDALTVGYYEGKNLRFASKVRAGFVAHARRELAARLAPLRMNECPFEQDAAGKKSRWAGGLSAEDMQQMRWTKPELVAQIQFTEWTAEGRLRNAAYLGLRQDKSAADVRREL